MKIREWDEARLEPVFGQAGEWLLDQLDEIDSPEVAAYAVHLPEDGTRAGRGDRTPRRSLVVSVLGLLDATYRPGDHGDAVMEARLVPWATVAGLELLTETRLDEALRHRTTWRVRISEPSVDLSNPVDDHALLDFWRECALRVGRSPTEEPRSPE